MARFTRDRRLVEAIIDGVAEMHSRHAADGQFDTHDLINWLNTHRNNELNDLYDLYRNCADPEMTADQQIGRFLYNLGQIRIGETVSPRQITRRGGSDRNGTCHASVWEASDRAREGLVAARETFFGREGLFARIAQESTPPPASNWIERISGSFKGDPVFEEIVRLGRELREADRPQDDD